MTPRDFIIRLRSSVIDENVAIYRDLFTNTRLDKVSDVYWKKALALFDSMPSEQKDIFFQVLRQVAVDSTSNVLGIIDGVASLDGTSSDFRLTYGDNLELLNGDLQSLFLVEVDRAQRA